MAVDRFDKTQAEQAKKRLISSRPGDGAGISKDESGYILHLMIQAGDHKNFPREFEGFPVKVSIVSEVKFS